MNLIVKLFSVRTQSPNPVHCPLTTISMHLLVYIYFLKCKHWSSQTPSKRWECALLRSLAAQPIAWVWGVATMCLFTDNTSCSFIQTQNQKALVHLVQSTRAHRDHWQKRCLCIYQPDAPRYDEKTRDAKTCADVLLGNTPFICKSQDWTIQHCVLH